MTLDELKLLDKVVQAKYALLSDYLEASKKAQEILKREIKLKTMMPNLSEESDRDKNGYTS